MIKPFSCGDLTGKQAREERIPLELTVRRRRGCRSSASFAIHDISGIPGSYMDRVGEFGSWGGTQEGTQTFPPPYLAGYSEFERTRRLDGSAGISRSAIEATSTAGVTPVVSDIRCLPGTHLPLGMPRLEIPILVIAGLVATIIHLLLSQSHGPGWLRRGRCLWWAWRPWRDSPQHVAGSTRFASEDRTELGHRLLHLGQGPFRRTLHLV